jgi:hypothetical protein
MNTFEKKLNNAHPENNNFLVPKLIDMLSRFDNISLLLTSKKMYLFYPTFIERMWIPSNALDMLNSRCLVSFVRKLIINKDFNPTTVYNTKIIQPPILELQTGFTIVKRKGRMLTIKKKEPLVPGVLPYYLTHLYIDHNFNEPLVPGVLPYGLTHLTFIGSYTNRLVEGSLPVSLTHLTFHLGYMHGLMNGVLPDGLTHLTFGTGDCQKLIPGVMPIYKKRNQLPFKMVY